VSGALVGLRAASSRASGAPAPQWGEARVVAPGARDGGEASGLVALGRTIFFDTRLSEPPGMSCATCHDPAHGYAGNNGSALGVAQGSRPAHFAKRNTPSVLYLGFVRRFHFHWEEDAPLPDAFGGFFWDGRVDTLAELTRQPLLNADEMGNRDVAAIADKIAASAYAGDLRRELGATDTPEASVAALGKAVEAFLLSASMSPFSSRYDDYVRGKITFTPLEARGLALFKDPSKGACSSCHKLNDTSPNPERSPFSDYGFETVAAPRNPRIPANRDPNTPTSASASTTTRSARRAIRGFAGAFERRPSGTSRPARRSCTTAPSRACATSSPSTPRARRPRSAGTAGRSTTTCR
jgi:cytochrome c peroxidase